MKRKRPNNGRPGATPDQATPPDDVEFRALEVAALGVVPLALSDEGDWDPEHEYRGEEGEPIDEWTKPIIARGKRPMFEMEHGARRSSTGSRSTCVQRTLT